jgi:hypothetical protein
MSIAIVIYVGIAALLLGGVWVIQHSQNPADYGKAPKQKKIPTRMDDLVEARQRLERQIEILECPAGGPSFRNAPPDTAAEVKELKRVLSEVTQELDDLSRPPNRRAT